ncbi:MAG: ribosome maturation factor RimM [Anaerolineales bacterium]|nr:ribosome maturation factor RimM [Anaerolineales bacterium]
MLSNPSPDRMSAASERPAGSPSAGEPALLVVGKIRRPHGVAGEALVEIYTDFPERLAPKTLIFVGAAHQPLTIRKRRPHKDGLLLAFEDITTPEQVGLLRNLMISISAADRPPLPEGEYYHHQILGLSVVDEDGQELGKLAEILETGANDVYVVTRDDGTELLLPAISDVLLDIDLPRKTMRVHLLPGLIREERE